VAGSCRARRCSTFWDELWVRTLCPRSRTAPAYSFTQQDAPYLAASDLNAHLFLCGLGQGIQSPVGSLGLVEGLRWQPIVAEEFSRRILGDQSDDPGALLFRDARLASGSGAISEPIYPFGIEAVMEALSYGLRMTSKLLSDLGRA
jgi:hypothetical protein